MRDKSILKKIVFTIILSILFQFCKFNSDIDRDMNNPTDAPVNLLLTPAEMLVGYTWGGSFSRYNGIFSQQLEGFDAQFLVINNYTFLRSDTDDPWDNMYRSLYSCNEIISKASTTSPHYSGVAKVLMSYTLGTLTSHYGDIPFTEALKGESGKAQPKFDTQESIYNQIQVLLDQAINDLSASNSILSPGSDDVLYGGDLEKWKKVAYALKARYHLHTSKVLPSSLNSIITELDSAGLYSNGYSDFSIKFTGASATSQAPWYQFNDQRATIIPNFVLLDTLLKYNDTRRNIYMDLTTANGINWFGSYLMGAGDLVNMIGKTELYFISAETKFKLGDLVGAAADLNSGIAASFSETGATFSFPIVFTSANITLNSIMTQKWAALWLNPEAFIDWRRTGFPAILPTNGVAIPRKYPYPQKEVNYNSINIPDEGVTPYLKRMWIDPV